MEEARQRWTRWRVVAWLVLATLTCWWHGPSLVASIKPARTEIVDFYQEWASAKNCVESLPIYTNQEITVQRYLGARRPSPHSYLIEINAHPPTAVLLAMPFVGLDYPEAVLA